MSVFRVEDLLARKISRFNSHFDPERSSNYSLKDFLDEVKGKEHKSLIEQIRQKGASLANLSSEKEKKELKEDIGKLKEKLPCVTLSGVGDRKLLDEHSGLLQVDLDKSEHADWDVAEMFDVINNDPHVVASFLSPSGGVKAIVPIERDPYNHLECFQSAKDYFENLGLTMDKYTKDIQRLCYLSYDPKPFVACGEVELFLPSINATQKHRNTVTKKHSNKGEYKKTSRSDVIRVLQAAGKEELRWMGDAYSDPRVVGLWKEFVFERYEVDFNKRNDILCDFIPYAHSRMSYDSAMLIAKQMRVLWDFFCTDPMSEHMKQAESLWNGCEQTFLDKLNSEELECYQLLETAELQDVFRICRDLAFCEKGKVGQFFLSSRNLGLRLGKEHTRAWRKLRQMKRFGIIQELIKGTRGSTGSASTFEWSL